MEEVFDVIVVGLGPAGAAAAASLARAGARVLALDGRPRHPKPCGGCLSERGARILDQFHPPAWLRDHPVRAIRLERAGRPGLRHQTATPGAWLVERSRLDAWFRETAAQAGARLETCRARRLERAEGQWRVEGRRGAWRARWLLGADGANGLVGRVLGLGRSGFAYLALVEERPLSVPEVGAWAGTALLELGGAAGGYAWAFGRGQSLNLGLAGRVGRVRDTRELLKNYHEFLVRQGLGRPGAWRGALIPCQDGSASRLVDGRAAVIGDAAAAADPFLGEGIGPAVQTGLAASRAILSGDLGLYQAEMLAGLWREHAHARLLARLIYRAPGVFQGLARWRPRALDLAWGLLRGELTYAGLWRALGQRIWPGGRPLAKA